MSKVSTNGQIQNLTDSEISYVTSFDWQGHVVGQYPSPILHKDTGTFQHVGNQNGGSEAAVVYLTKNKNDKSYHAIAAWLNESSSPKSKAYALIAEPKPFTNELWGEIHDKLHNSNTNSSSTHDGLTLTVQIGEGDSPTLLATISYA
ncbi:uncharacterized protein LOC111295178 [Durio zibethinus]|uniref:Uncharacterized protein LOC111295178 n=1 Tax=Durio zibethinus TaxID=66656 RepID=A0A6P5YVP3_DURZI|nr:uncharacterized protein LOC111295178 [Durio zibethinus]